MVPIVSLGVPAVTLIVIPSEVEGSHIFHPQVVGSLRQAQGRLLDFAREPVRFQDDNKPEHFSQLPLRGLYLRVPRK